MLNNNNSKEKILSKNHLESLLKLTQFGRCWGIVKSHLLMYSVLDSITCLCVEGVEFMSRTELAESILKEIDNAKR